MDYLRVTEEPGGLQSMGSLRVRHDWATSLSLFTFMHWRRKWQPTPVFLPGESQGRGAWWAAVYGVTQSRTRLKRLTSSSSYYGLNVSPQNSYVEIHHMMVLGGRAFGRWLGHEGGILMNDVQFSSVQSLNCVRLFATPWIAALQVSLSITNTRSSLRLTSIESMMSSTSHPQSSPSPPASNPSQHQSLFQWVNTSHEVAKVLEFQL